MPGVIRSSSVSSESGSGSDKSPLHVTSPSSAGSSAILDQDDYAAKSFPEYAEKPLEEQLEPIAVVGMGKY
jgi:hypothetical protein